MGLIKAALGSAGGVLADQWKEYFYCDSIPADVLVTKGVKRTSDRSSNTKGFDNIITNGSIIAVADGQCMIIVDQGKVTELCAVPGEFQYDSSTEPSIFDDGKLVENIKSVFGNIGKRFTFGGEAPKDQRVYFVNTKEIMGNKYGTASAVPFRVVDERAAIDIDISVKCFGEYTYRITDPITFYTNVVGNVTTEYKRSEIDSQLKSEFLTALQPAFARISEMGIRYSALPGHAKELAEAMAQELTVEWKERRGIEVQKVGVNSIKASEEDEQMIKDMQRDVAWMDPTRAAAHTVGAQAEAMKAAASNPNGAAMAFMGMGMAQNAGGSQASQLFQMGQANPSPAPAPTPSPAKAAAAPAADEWTCPSCGAKVVGKFCTECGAKKPSNDGWTCSCGAVNKGKFCSECGSKKPEGAPQYKCDKCGWEPEDPFNPPKFCPECGDPFGDEDIK